MRAVAVAGAVANVNVMRARVLLVALLLPH